MYRSPRRLHLTRDGKVCLPGDPKSASLLVAEGGELSDEDAKKYGLIGGGSGASGPGEDALPLDSPPAPAQPQAPDPKAAQVVEAAAASFPREIHFGTPPPAPASATPPAPVQPPATTQPQVATTEAPTQPPAPAAPVAAPVSDLPDDFPFKSILVNQHFGMAAQVKAATKEQLIALDQIGAARADEIIAASSKLA